MAKRERLLKSMRTKDGSTIEVKLDYRMGGWNYFTGVNMERGLYLSVSPVKISISQCGKYSTKSYTAFTGICHLVKPQSRFNQKSFDNFQPDNETIDKMVQSVLTKNNIVLERAE